MKLWTKFVQRPTPLTVFLAAAVLLGDYLTGPHIRFPLMFVLPVGLAVWNRRPKLGLWLAVLIPLVRLAYCRAWHIDEYQFAVELVCATLRCAALVLVAALIQRMAGQRDALQREVHMLEGMLPICCFCKDVRDSAGGWHKIESYIASRSDARFTHSYCPACSAKHFPELLNYKAELTRLGRDAKTAVPPGTPAPTVADVSCRM